MKKIAVVLCVLTTLILTFTSCGMNDVKNNVEQGVKDTKDMAKDAKQEVENMVKDPMETAKEFTSMENKEVDRTNFITEEVAKQNAVKRANVNADAVKFIKCEFEKDDDRYVYDIEFVSGNKEYEVEISANDGTVISYDEDRKD